MEKPLHHIAPNTTHTFTIEQIIEPIRIDILLTHYFPEFSRSYFQRLIKSGNVICNDKIVIKPGLLVETGNKITAHFPQVASKRKPRNLPAELTVEILYEHPDFLIINKPAGLIVHDPSHYHTAATLVDWLLAHFKEIQNVGSFDRPGIVHRLDQFTSGIMIIPRTNYAHTTFGNMFRDRAIKKEYLALVEGNPEPEGVIDFTVGRNPHKRNQMTHKHPYGRAAVTYYKVLEYYEKAALVQVKPITGRTHQIRVHFAAIGHPILGDILYGRPSKYIQRQALHAHALSFTYNNIPFHFTCAIPKDIEKAIQTFKKTYN